MRDKERGVVWEETIILLPHKARLPMTQQSELCDSPDSLQVRYVFLSATIPNSQEFAGWIASVHQQVLRRLRRPHHFEIVFGAAVAP